MRLDTVFQWPQWASASCLGLLACLLSLHYVEKSISTHRNRKSLVDEVDATDDNRAFTLFQRQYLVVYAFVMFADWLQGTHMYSLYQVDAESFSPFHLHLLFCHYKSAYNLNVGVLFLTGFFSSIVFGNFIGPLVDKYGRRKACLFYCALEVVINILENIPNMVLLLVGRMLGGISTSLLFSAFESWMVTEHRARFSKNLLAKTFALASEINGIVAVLSGLIAQIAAEAIGDIGPFRVAVVVTIVAAAFVFSWSENYGSPLKTVNEKLEKMGISEDKEVRSNDDSDMSGNAYALGFCYSLFEGAMYVFVFLWHPTLEVVVPDMRLPSGLVFSSFMLSMASGGKIFDLINTLRFREELLLFMATAASAISLLIPTVAWVTEDYRFIFGGFLAFEVSCCGRKRYSDLINVCVGIISPCCATLRSRYFPNDQLSTNLTLFRLPANALVVIGICGATYWTREQLYYGCSVVLAAATGCAGKLAQASIAESTRRKKLKIV
ncbi:hypothetical protein PsorP6_004465 [Peronosclerospora sorghi]|uniref:Uncharacterized protein n=1 Tax=Peronosclerospora sorghi TaxID=230839 RepID=A0ACC0VK31_9STRA|nr:hypothetical protein PsorP6_004465 [Peronosclerospora sorghi]